MFLKLPFTSNTHRVKATGERSLQIEVGESNTNAVTWNEIDLFDIGNRVLS